MSNSNRRSGILTIGRGGQYGSDETTVVAELPDSGSESVFGLPSDLALSPSRANDFLTCPLLFRFRAIDRIPERPSSAAVRGTLVHAVLESIFDLPRSDRQLEAAIGSLAATFEGMIDSDPALGYALADDEFVPDSAPNLAADTVHSWLQAAVPLLRTYYRLEDPTTFDPYEREVKLTAQLDCGLTLRGIVDRVDVSSNGLTRVVDYKTGRSPGVGFEQKAMFQLRFYALMLKASGQPLPSQLQLMYLGDGQLLYYEPDEHDMEAFERKLVALWDTITSVSRTGDWIARPSSGCRFCDHHALCPAKGGTAPPLAPKLPGSTEIRLLP